MLDYVKYIRDFVGNNKIIMVAASAIIEENEKILIQKRTDNGLWGLPGGCMEMDESIITCLKREIKEETNLEVEVDHLIGVYNNYDMCWSSGDLAHVIDFIFKVNVVGGLLKKDSESIELRFFDKMSIPTLHTETNMKAVNDYLNKKKNILEE